MDFILADYNVPFMASLLIVMLITALECIGALIGISSTHLFDKFDVDYTIDTSPPLEISHHVPSIFEYIFAWMRVPKIPLLIVILIVLFLFGSVGLTLQSFSLTYFGTTLSYIWSIPLTLAIVFPVSLILSHVIAYFLPNDSSSAVSLNSLVGNTAEITLGTASKGFPTTAKCRDSMGKMHHFLVEPEDSQETFNYGEKVLLIRCINGRFHALRA
ncbi:MAG: DUF1449 family protein [Parachlamydiaceae bacterium]|nr:DUF1449 family protein [Parachlamydiaceae bacterium]